MSFKNHAVKTDIQIFDSPETVAAQCADFLYGYLQDKTKIHLALSGGSTPQLLFKLLAAAGKRPMDWHKIHLYWGDERCVPPDHSDSNYSVARELLLKYIDIPSGNIHRIRGEEEPEVEARRYGKEIRSALPAHSGLPVFDIILLGMGEDGHTASIFPHEPELLDRGSICAVARHPETGQQRVTLTGPVINAAREVIFLVTGLGKAEKVKEILNKEGAWKGYPAAHIQPGNGNLHWFLDKDAGSKVL